MSAEIWQKAFFKISNDDAGTFSGYASKYNGIDSYGDTILPGAYEAILSSGKMPKMFFNHRTWELPVGDWLEMEGREDGLYVKGQLDLTIPAARDIYHAMKAGRIDGLSVSIEMEQGGYAQKDPDDFWSGYDISKVSDMREISLCTFPADNSARVDAVKSADIEKIQTIRDIEKILRDADFSKTQAGAFIAATRAVIQRDIAEKARRDARDAQLAAIKAKLDNIMERLQ